MDDELEEDADDDDDNNESSEVDDLGSELSEEAYIDEEE